MLFLSLASILTAFHYYPVAHGLTMVWYLCKSIDYTVSVFKGFLPDYYKYMVFPLVFAILMTILGSSIKEIVYPSNVDIMQAIIPIEEEEVRHIEEIKPTEEEEVRHIEEIKPTEEEEVRHIEEIKPTEEEAVTPLEEIVSTI